MPRVGPCNQIKQMYQRSGFSEADAVLKANELMAESPEWRKVEIVEYDDPEHNEAIGGDNAPKLYQVSAFRYVCACSKQPKRK